MYVSTDTCILWICNYFPLKPNNSNHPNVAFFNFHARYVTVDMLIFHQQPATIFHPPNSSYYFPWPSYKSICSCTRDLSNFNPNFTSAFTFCGYFFHFFQNQILWTPPFSQLRTNYNSSSPLITNDLPGLQTLKHILRHSHHILLFDLQPVFSSSLKHIPPPI